MKNSTENNSNEDASNEPQTENYNNKRRVHKFLDINERFRLTRKYYGLTQDDFALQLGIDKNAVRAIESGRITPNIEVMRKWKAKTGRSYDWIIDGKESIKTETNQ